MTIQPASSVGMTNFRSESLDRLFEAVLRLESVDECYNFFEDVCTINEVQDMAQRFDVALLLDKGKNYQAISKEVNVLVLVSVRVKTMSTQYMIDMKTGKSIEDAGRSTRDRMKAPIKENIKKDIRNMSR